MNTTKISGATLRDLKAKAQLLDPIFRVGKAGVTTEFLSLLDAALRRRQLVKIKFEGENKERKKELAPEIAAQTSSQLILRVGNTAVFYRGV
jgi:RNA-binding protein